MTLFKDKLTEYHLTNGVPILCNTSDFTPRPFVPSVARIPIISSLHNLSHPGRQATSKIVKQRHFWPNMDKETQKFLSECTYGLSAG